jgi:hypothetical protein
VGRDTVLRMKSVYGLTLLLHINPLEPRYVGTPGNCGFFSNSPCHWNRTEAADNPDQVRMITFLETASVSLKDYLLEDRDMMRIEKSTA